MYDVVIIGAGVTGCAVARELGKYGGKFLVLEKEEDVCCGTSKANSAIVHSGYDAVPGTNMAKMNVQGNAMMEDVCKDLDVPFDRIGSLLVCTEEEQRTALQELYERGIQNGVPDLRIVERDEALAMEPNLSDAVVAALYAPTAGIICPFKLTIAFAENANENGVEFQFDTKVTGLQKQGDGWTITTDSGEKIETRCVVNAAGVYADELNNLVSSRKLHITPRRGDYCLLDKSVGGYVKHTVFQLPTRFGKGVLVSPTVHGNTLVGPTAIDVEDKEATATTQEGLDKLIEQSAIGMKNIPIRSVITSFAGLRAHEDGHEFILGEAEDAAGFFNCAGIESPGLSSAPAIGKYTAELLQKKLSLVEKADWKKTRKDIQTLDGLTIEEKNALIKENPAYGTIICRCESVTEGEILDAIRRPLGAKSLDGVKRRTRAGMGRCQAGFCSPRVMEILVRERGVEMEAITKSGGDARIVIGTLPLRQTGEASGDTGIQAEIQD